MRKWIVLSSFLGIAFSAMAHSGEGLKMEADELRKEVRSMNSIVEPVFNTTVHNYIKWYMEGPEDYTNSLMERSAMYFPQIERKLALAGLPDDLKYLVVIESSVKPDISSHMGASGLWQLMIPTARYCGLTIDYSVDERLDPERSTQAAIIYLKELYEQFNDWSLVMAAYNSGPGRLRRAMRTAGSNDYWEVAKYLPRETRRYVPKFIAAQYLYSKLYKDKMSEVNVPNDLVFTSNVRLTRATSLSEVAKVTGLEIELLEQLNTSWRRNKVGDSKGQYTLRIPSRVVDQWLAYDRSRETEPMDMLAEATEGKLLYTADQYYYEIQYPIQKGERLDEIADLFDLNPVLIRWWNDLKPFESMKKGQQLKIIIPHNDACFYIKDVLDDSKDAELLEGLELTQFDRSNMPIQGFAGELDFHVPKREDEYHPMIIPRGMSIAEYVSGK